MRDISVPPRPDGLPDLANHLATDAAAAALVTGEDALVRAQNGDAVATADLGNAVLARENPAARPADPADPLDDTRPLAAAIVVLQVQTQRDRKSTRLTS